MADGIDDALPFLSAALKRFLAEYSSTQNGLSLTAHYTLDALTDGPADAVTFFRRSQYRERHPFLGDSDSFQSRNASSPASARLSWKWTRLKTMSTLAAVGSR